MYTTITLAEAATAGPRLRLHGRPRLGQPSADCGGSGVAASTSWHWRRELRQRACGLAEHTFDRFVEIKRQEWDDYRVQVSRWELERYLPVL